MVLPMSSYITNVVFHDPKSNRFYPNGSRHFCSVNNPSRRSTPPFPASDGTIAPRLTMGAESAVGVEPRQRMVSSCPGLEQLPMKSGAPPARRGLPVDRHPSFSSPGPAVPVHVRFLAVAKENVTLDALRGPSVYFLVEISGHLGVVGMFGFLFRALR